MQCQTNISGLRSTRYIPLLGVLWFAIAGILCHATPDLGARGAGWVSRPGAQTAPPPQTTPVARGDDTNPDTDTLRIAGESRLPLAPGAFVDSPACSPPKNSLSLNPCWHAHERPPASLNLKALSALAIWCNCGQAPTPTGRRVCSWSARCATMTACLASCCGPTGAAIARLGTRTACLRYCELGGPRSRPLEGQSTAPATLRTARGAWEGTRSKHLIRYRNSVPTAFAGRRPDNEHYAAPCRSP
jgi:hypothetical protein